MESNNKGDNNAEYSKSYCYLVVCYINLGYYVHFIYMNPCKAVIKCEELNSEYSKENRVKELMKSLGDTEEIANKWVSMNRCEFRVEVIEISD